MSERTSFFFPSSAGHSRIHAMQWAPDDGTALRGVVQILHGVAEHIERYDELACYLNNHGYAVVGNDHLGHGKSVSSDTDYGYFADKDGWTHVCNDVRTLQIMTARRFPNVPYFLLGHSMGSFLARTYLIRFPGTVHGAILCGTGQMSSALIAAGQSAGRLEALLTDVEDFAGDFSDIVFFLLGDEGERRDRVEGDGDPDAPPPEVLVEPHEHPDPQRTGEQHG